MKQGNLIIAQENTETSACTKQWRSVTCSLAFFFFFPASRRMPGENPWAIDLSTAWQQDAVSLGQDYQMFEFPQC